MVVYIAVGCIACHNATPCNIFPDALGGDQAAYNLMTIKVILTFESNYD